MAVLLSIFESVPAVKAFFTGRGWGNMKYPIGDHNREAFVQQKLGGFPLILADVAHGKMVGKVGLGSPSVIQFVDGLVTNEPGVFIAVTAADCFPVYFYDPKARVIGIAHGSWRTIIGEGGSIIENTLAQMRLLKANPQNIRAMIGPGICHHCYEFGPEAKEIFAEFFGARELKYRGGGKYAVDLGLIIELQLIRAGIQRENLDNMKVCTFEKSGVLFSARHDKFNPVQAGLAAIGIRDRKRESDLARRHQEEKEELAICA